MLFNNYENDNQILQILVKIIDYKNQVGVIIGYKESNDRIKKFPLVSYVLNISNKIYRLNRLVLLDTSEFNNTKRPDNIDLPKDYSYNYYSYDGKPKSIEYSEDGYISNDKELDYLNGNFNDYSLSTKETAHLHDFDEYFEKVDFEKVNEKMEYYKSAFEKMMESMGSIFNNN